ncbi:DUF397 domain-containing protein [Streptomyces sp. NPDC018693]|uniref:DUF397 domain-containing protein n=1 Tax=unclassified Streptomyces TaxID=2593676 RepID=UPI0037A48F24
MTSTGSLRWFRSSHSDSGGGACVEVAFDWRKSSYSDGGGGNCVEVAHQAPHTIHIRDSKQAEAGPIVTVSGEAWADFLTYAAR